MARPKKTPGDYLVEEIKKATIDELGMSETPENVRWGPDELPRLELIRRTANDLDALEKAWADDVANGLFKVRGSRGQDVVNPLVSEIRMQRAALNTLLRAYKSEASGLSTTASERGRHAATARWSPEQAAQAMQLRWGPGGTG